LATLFNPNSSLHVLDEVVVIMIYGQV